MRISFIDMGNEDFLRNDDDEVIKVRVDNVQQAEDWLLKNGEDVGWTNEGVRFFNWDER